MAPRPGDSQPGMLTLLAHKLTARMRARFGEAASDANAQQIIKREVVAFMRRVGTGGMQEDELVELENRIRAGLTGSTPMKLTYSMEKRAQVQGDEWAKMFQYHIHKGLALDRLDAEAARRRKAALKAQLDEQTRELEARKRAERAQEQAYFREEQASLRAWEAQEERKRQQLASSIQRLGQERIEQLKDKEERRMKATRRVREEDEDLAAKIAYMTLTEARQEEEQWNQQRVQLRGYLEGNELNKKLREEEKLRQAQEDAEFQRKWAAQLDKQEADRKAFLAKAKIKQDLQAAAAAERPECKRWIDPEIIERHYRQREEAQEKEEQRRKQRIKDAEMAAVQTLTVQMKEREEAKHQEVLRDKEAAKVVLDRVRREEEKERERQRKAEEAKATFRILLENQMKDNARRRRVAPMTETERRFNRKLLDEVQDWQLTGTMTL